MHGKIAKQYGYYLELELVSSNRGWYIGTKIDGTPVSRESVEYWKTKALAQKAMASGTWTQRTEA